MKLVNFYRKPISVLVIVTFAILLCFWANQSPAVPAAEKKSEATLEQGDSDNPTFFEQEREDAAAIKKAKKFPWLIVGLGAVVVGVTLYFLVIKKPQYTLTVNLGSGTIGTPAVAGKYKKGTVVNYNYTAQADYFGLQVKLDDAVVATSGTVTMNSDHALGISATKNSTTYSNGVLTVNGVRYELASIPAGEFQMGRDSPETYDDEKPVHTVRISKGFRMGKTEVTQGLWEAVMGSNPSHFKYGDNFPVERVSDDDCLSFIQNLNQMLGGNAFRLPTEAEWEYACRAGTTGDRYGNLIAIAWYAGNSGGSTHPVADLQPNAFGLYDTLGNVEEWCQDWYDEDYYKYSPAVDPTGPAWGDFHVQRGGWYGGVAAATYCAHRHWHFPGELYDWQGFRLARTNEQPF